MVKDTPASIEFIEKWFDLCKNKEFLTGKNSGPGNHFHDQSLLILPIIHTLLERQPQVQKGL